MSFQRSMGRRSRSGGVAGAAVIGLCLAAATPATHAGAVLHGPDAIIRETTDTRRWDANETEIAYSAGVVICNVGDENLRIEAQPDLDHPVWGLNMFRLSSDGRFAQIGQSWLRHGFCALARSHEGCGECEQGGGCHPFLSPSCSFSKTATRMGGQAGLGPKWQVNPHTGAFPLPWHNGEGTDGNFRRRLRVRNADVDPSTNFGATYFLEYQIVAADEAAVRNQNNSASYRRVSVDPETLGLTPLGATRVERPAIEAWREHVTDVTLVDIQADADGEPDPNTGLFDDGLFIVGYAVGEHGDGTWRYEYAIQNLNSHRAARAFTVPVPADVELTAIGFHDVDYHSGDGIDGMNFDGTDWTVIHGANGLTWSTETSEENENANALRWGTLYNFGFTADTPPRTATGRINLFRPGDPAFMPVTLHGPRSATCPADVTDSGTVDFDDLLAVLDAWGPCERCAEDLDLSGTVDFDDLLMVLAAWGPCE